MDTSYVPSMEDFLYGTTVGSSTPMVNPPKPVADKPEILSTTTVPAGCVCSCQCAKEIKPIVTGIEEMKTELKELSKGVDMIFAYLYNNTSSDSESGEEDPIGRDSEDDGGDESEDLEDTRDSDEADLKRPQTPPTKKDMEFIDDSKLKITNGGSRRRIRTSDCDERPTKKIKTIKMDDENEN